MAFDVANNNPPRSIFQKTVELQDWWLTKPQTADDDAETKTLGVAGLTCTSLKIRAGRCFSSAPILRVHSIFELETDDGVSVILKGYINKDRTLENGFPHEVFDHFVIGFPHNWKEFCTSCPKRESGAKHVSSGLVFPVNKERIEEHAEFHDESHGKPVDTGIPDIILKNKNTTASSLEIPHEHIVKAGHEVLCEKSPVTPEFKNGPTVRNGVDSSTGSRCLKVSSRRMTRSMTKLDNNSPLLHDIFNLDKVNLIDPKNTCANVVNFDLKSESRKIVSEKKLNETANCSEDVVLRMKSKRKQNDQKADVIDQDVEAKRFKSECLDPLNSTNVDDDLVILRTLLKGCKNKKKNRESVDSKHVIDSRKTVVTKSRSKFLTPEKSNCKMAKKQLITSPKSHSRGKKGSKEEYGNFNILSPKSFSGKKSRSGRVLLPSLEFWRNQRVVYDEGGELFGVQEPK